MMPIILKDHSWSQTEDTLYVRLNVKGIRADKTSFITSDNYIRLYNPPYVFELFLWGEVDEVNGKCTLNEKDAQVLFEMPKKPLQNPQIDAAAASGDSQINDNSNEWPCLELTNLNRFEKHEIRTRACEMSQKRAQMEIQAALEKRQQNKQMTVQEQIRLDEEARHRIARIKTFESESFMTGGENQWQDDSSATESERTIRDDKIKAVVAKLARASLENECEADNIDELDETANGDNNSRDRDQIWSKMELAASKRFERTPKEKPPPVITPVRQGGSIKVSFTPREFPTPSRESTEAEEEEWLAKQLEARKHSGFDELNLKPEERDPSWLLQKGHDLMKTDSYLGATSAFTTGIKLAPKLPQLYVGRAQAQLALGNCIKTVEDSSQAIQLLTPKVPQNMSERLSCLVCRGQAFRKLGMFKEAIEDYREALLLDPENKQLAQEYVTVQKEELETADDGSSDED